MEIYGGVFKWDSAEKTYTIEAESLYVVKAGVQVRECKAVPVQRKINKSSSSVADSPPLFERDAPGHDDDVAIKRSYAPQKAGDMKSVIFVS